MGLAIAELTEITPSPAKGPVSRCYGASMVVPGVDHAELMCANYPGRLRTPVNVRAVTQLAIGIVAPAIGEIVRSYGAGVHRPHTDLAHEECPSHGDRRYIGVPGAIAELPLEIATPAVALT
jgi:hypothetical protein